MRVLTLNLWGRRGAWAARRQVLIEGLRALSPDLVAFQESIVNDEYDQVRDLLGPGFHVVHQRAREPGGPEDVEVGQGISIASRWPLGEVRELDLHVTSRTSDFACVRWCLTSRVRVWASDHFGVVAELEVPGT